MITFREAFWQVSYSNWLRPIRILHENYCQHSKCWTRHHSTVSPPGSGDKQRVHTCFQQPITSPLKIRASPFPVQPSSTKPKPNLRQKQNQKKTNTPITRSTQKAMKSLSIVRRNEERTAPSSFVAVVDRLRECSRAVALRDELDRFLVDFDAVT